MTEEYKELFSEVFLETGSDVYDFGLSETVDPTLFIVIFRTTSPAESITLPLNAGYAHNFTVAWGDGSSSEITTHNDADRTHVYASAGDHEVVISGTTESWDFYLHDSSNAKIIDIKQWGSNPWKFLYEAFYGCPNLVISATDAPNLANLAQPGDLSYMLSTCNSLTINPIGLALWNLSTVDWLIDFTSNSPLFTGAGLGNWDVSTVEDVIGAFYECLAFAENLSSWDISNVSYAAGMLQNTAISTTDYSEMLIAWAALPGIQSGVSLGAQGLTYSTDAVAARLFLTGTKGWTITDGGLA